MPADIRVIAIDFDGCLCADRWPEIGAPHMDTINDAIAERAAGTKLILWTCRVGKLVDDAVVWCARHGLCFDAVNDNVQEIKDKYGTESRKVSADEYWDDRARLKPGRKGGE